MLFFYILVIFVQFSKFLHGHENTNKTHGKFDNTKTLDSLFSSAF